MNRDPGPTGSPVSLWRHQDFLYLWAGTSISLVGTAISGLALPFVAVLTLHAGPAQMGLLGALGLLPYLLVSLVAGVWVDRTRRRPLMITCDVGRAVLLATIPAAALLGKLTIGQLYGVAFLTGTLSVLFGVAYQAYLLPLVGLDQLAEGNTKLGASNAAAQVIGLGIGGTLVQLLTAPLAVVLDAVSYLASAISIALIRSPEPEVTYASRGSAWREMSEGLRLLLRQPILRALTQAWIFYEIAAGIVVTVYMLYLVRDLRLTPAVIGLIQVCSAISGMAGAVLAHRAARTVGLGPAIWIAFLVITAGSCLMLLASVVRPDALPLMLTSAVLTGMALPASGINQTTLRQSVTPPDMQGRVSASFAFATSGIRPVGALLGGFLGQALGLRSTIAAALLITLAVAVLLVASPVRNVRGLLAAPDT